MSTAAPDAELDPPPPASKPPFLRDVEIRGYKSIAFCNVKLEPLTILVGRNASGKSNFLDALGFLRDLMRGSVVEVVDGRGGWRAIHSRNARTQNIEMAARFTFESRGGTWDADYFFVVEPKKYGQLGVGTEALNMIEQSSGSRAGFSAVGEQVEWYGVDPITGKVAPEVRKPNPAVFGGRRGSHLVLSRILTPPYSDLAESLRSSGIYNFSPIAIRSLRPVDSNPVLSADGSNLARVIGKLKEIEPTQVDRVNTYMRAIVPELHSFAVGRYADMETVHFLIEQGSSAAPQVYRASSMSDGTLRALAALVASRQVSLPAGEVGFIGIEEPETALHPAAVRVLVDALDEATLRTQILLTTHSVDILDNPTVQPENVRIVQMVGGRTVIGKLDEVNAEVVRRNFDTLGGLERGDRLEIDPDDLERQRKLAPAEWGAGG